MSQMSDKKSRFPIFQERLRELQGRMNNVEFSEFLGMSRQTVGFYLNGDRIPDILGLVNIAQKCNVSTDWLVGLSDIKSTSGDVQQACNFTGLSQEAVQNFHSCIITPTNVHNLNPQDIVNSLFADTEVSKNIMVYMLHSYHSFFWSDSDVITSEWSDPGVKRYPPPQIDLDTVIYLQNNSCIPLPYSEAKIYYLDRAMDLIKEKIKHAFTTMMYHEVFGGETTHPTDTSER